MHYWYSCNVLVKIFAQVSIEDGSVMIVPGMSYDGRPATVTMPDVLPEDCDSIVHVINKVRPQASLLLP